MNNGKYSGQVVTTPPTWAARNGEFAFLNSSGALRMYFYASNQWNYIQGSTSGTAVTSKVATTTRDMGAASGDVSYTGLGFKPSVIVAFAAGDILQIASWGFSSNIIAGIRHNDVDTISGISGPDSYFIQLLQVSGSEHQAASLSTYDSDGFTLTWNKSGTPPAGTAKIKFLCFQ